MFQSRPMLRKVGYGAAVGVGAIWSIGLVTQTGMSLTRRLRVKRARAQGLYCSLCKGSGKADCQACLTSGYLEFSERLEDSIAVVGLCPVCKGDGLQSCCNCSGNGVDLTSLQEPRNGG